jgi:hypothetical protein
MEADYRLRATGYRGEANLENGIGEWENRRAEETEKKTEDTSLSGSSILRFCCIDG